MNDDYLWNRSGPPDAEIVRLERTLASLRQESLPPLILRAPMSAWSEWIGVALLAASLAIMVGGVTLAYRFHPQAPGWEITSLERQRDLRIGGWLETNSREKATINVANVGTVSVEPLTRLRLIDTRTGNHRLELARGTVHARIWAPPGQFFVETPSSTAVDLGCAYTLTIDDEGSGLVSVALGWVGFEWHGRESFIPAGSMCATRPGVGPGTPYNEHVSPAFRAAIETIDFRSGSPDQVAALDLVLAEAQERDEVTLWHLLTRVDGGQRDRVFDRLTRFVPPPAGVTREGVRAGRRDMLDRWWDALGLGTASWWRTWKQPWRGSSR